jgi:hypothetical protein
LIVVAHQKRTDGVPKGDVPLLFDMESLLSEEVKTVKSSYTCIVFRGAIFISATVIFRSSDTAFEKPGYENHKITRNL